MSLPGFRNLFHGTKFVRPYMAFASWQQMVFCLTISSAASRQPL